MTIKIKKKSLHEIYQALFMFILIFQPPILPSMNIVIAGYSFFMLLLKYRRSWSSVLKNSGGLDWCLNALIILLYELFTICINFILGEQVQMSNYTAVFNRIILLTVVAVLCSLYLICYFKRNDFGQEEFIIAIIRAGMIQVICVFASFISSDIKSIFIAQMRRFSSSVLWENEWFITIRSYGFASTLVDLFGYGMGIIAGLSLFYGFFKSKKYIIYSFFIAIAGTMNARTTIVIYAVAIILAVIFFLSKQEIKNVLQISGFVVLIIILVSSLLPIIERINSSTYTWIMNGVDAITGILFENEKEGVFEALFSEQFWQIPGLFQIIFGSGHTLYGAEGYAHSDVGYINDLWSMGIVGITFLYGNIVMSITRVMRRNKNNVFNRMVFFVGVVYFLFNIKGNALGPNSGTLIVLSVIFVFRFFGSALEMEKQNE